MIIIQRFRHESLQSRKSRTSEREKWLKILIFFKYVELPNGQRECVSRGRSQFSMRGMISNFNHNWLFIFPGERERERNSKTIHVRKRKETKTGTRSYTPSSFPEGEESAGNSARPGLLGLFPVDLRARHRRVASRAGRARRS